MFKKSPLNNNKMRNLKMISNLNLRIIKQNKVKNKRVRNTVTTKNTFIKIGITNKEMITRAKTMTRGTTNIIKKVIIKREATKEMIMKIDRKLEISSKINRTTVKTMNTRTVKAKSVMIISNNSNHKHTKRTVHLINNKKYIQNNMINRSPQSVRNISVKNIQMRNTSKNKVKMILISPRYSKRN